MTPPDLIHQLVQRFSEHRTAYRSGDYNEAQVRLEFIDPFFETLGWDMFNKQGYAEAYKDVIHEDAIKMGGATKAPDYAFRIGGTRKFFVEAKKPSVSVKDEISPAYQLRRYAWSASLPLSILTDFEEFSVYDCRSKPDKSDKAATGRVMYLTFKEYPEKWEDIASIFAREAILKGSFDKYAESAKGKHGTAEVDDAFLAEIERWRDLLAHNLALRNPALSQRELNYAVQMTIDRLIFLRICEDRGIEFYGQLQALTNGGEVYPRLCQLFAKADQRYNSGLFHFREEKSQANSPDLLTMSLKIDDKPLKDILGNLYYPDSPYEFSVLPADILGQVYEQFLGKVIRLTSGHHAVVEDKPEVKKAGGVYYTPAYIVEYIVKNTVGKMVEGRKAGDKGVGDRGIPIRVLDPACGSGSFLLGAYQYLLDWYRDAYVSEGAEKWAKGKKPTIYQSGTGEWKLTTAERKRILLEHIYGVDIDPQAVEVTKLSLLLKVLEGESDQTLAHQLTFWQERALPDLGQNIKCGNSLIGSDFYQGKQATFLDAEEQYRINAFDWEREFPEVFGMKTLGVCDEYIAETPGVSKAGGFDVVIGNPPYVRQESISQFKSYFQKSYMVFSSTADLFVYFIERSLQLTSEGGLFSFIVSNKFIRAAYGEQLRRLIPAKAAIKQFLDFGDLPIFIGATVYPCIFVLQKEREAYHRDANQIEVCNIHTLKFGNLDDYVSESSFTVDQKALIGGNWQLHPRDEQQILLKIAHIGKPLSKYCGCEPLFGVKTGLNEVFIVPDNKIDLITKGAQGERTIFLPYLRGRNVHRYRYEHTGDNLLFTDGITEVSHPNVMTYLKANKSKLEARTDIIGTSKKWYELRPCKYYNLLRKPKIIYACVAQKGSFVLDKEGTFVDKTCYFIPSDDMYLLGLLNSQLLFYYFSHIAVQRRGGYFEYLTQYVTQLPIATHPSGSPEALAVSNLVERMLSLHQQLAAAKTPNEKTHLQRQIEATDREIDRLVYELYGLTEEEIKIVEGN